MAYSAVILSGSTNGQPVQVIALSSPGTTIHTCATATSAVEDIFLDAYNTATNTADVSIEFGATGQTVTASLPSKTGPYRIIAGSRLGGGAGIVIRAFATATGIITLTGGVNRSA